MNTGVSTRQPVASWLDVRIGQLSKMLRELLDGLFRFVDRSWIDVSRVFGSKEDVSLTERSGGGGIVLEPPVVTMPCNVANPSVTFTVKGSGPFRWSTSGGGLEIAADSKTAVLRPSKNDGAAVPGDAFVHVVKSIVAGCGDDGYYRRLGFCNGSLAPAGGTPPCFTSGNPAPGCAEGAPGCTVHGSGVEGPCSVPACGDQCQAPVNFGIVCDLRTPSMIAQGCRPCQVQFKSGVVVTVTDALGRSVQAVVRSG